MTPMFDHSNSRAYIQTEVIMKLRSIKKGSIAVVKKVSATGELGRRIRDFGLVPGTEIKLVGEAPLYDPVAIKIFGSIITLRNGEADFIEVEEV